MPGSLFFRRLSSHCNEIAALCGFHIGRQASVMKYRGRTALIVSGLLLSPLAMAQAGYIDIEQRLSAEQLQQVGLSSAQLQLLNRMLRESTPPISQAAPVVSSPLAASAAPSAPAMFIGLDDTPVQSRAVGEIRGWEPGSVFVLENGQHWKVLKGEMKLRKPMQSPQIAVVPGIAGRWFLQVDEDIPKARVYRIQ